MNRKPLFTIKRHDVLFIFWRIKKQTTSFCERNLPLILLALTVSNLYLLVTK